jgi:hypothetical protein
VDVNDTNAKLQIKNELKVVNIAQIKPFVEEAPKRLSKTNRALLRAINVLIKTTVVFFKTNSISLSPDP